MEGSLKSKEKKCPICDKVLRSDASIKISCALCGMGVPDLEQSFRYETLGGVMLYFCCDKCEKIYVENVLSK